MRNLATSAYAKALGFDVVADTQMGFMTTGQENVPGPQLGLVMERARGHEACKWQGAVHSHPHVMRETMKLQLLDHLTGQGDRHPSNCFIDVRPDGRVKVTGIDNDQCFGARLTDPAGIRNTHDPNAGYRGTGLPPVVDRQMADTIMNLTQNDVVKMLGNKLSEPEVNAALSRLSGVQQHVAQLHSQGLVLDATQWGQVSHLLTADNSYIGRELAATGNVKF
ncbi:hypothetical protein [Piscinibacter sp.]|uniref:hypothetical protein n=1 Tax=Piscinibacter sp. TaxID=1903157 RepID=UPI002CA8E53A|nr:hypothetical protein [Albitalea sp.]HUG21033.1 hypothetical protein [Albitalea sp.]